MAGFRFKTKEQEMRMILEKYIANCDWHITEFKGNSELVQEWSIRKYAAMDILARFDKV